MKRKIHNPKARRWKARQARTTRSLIGAERTHLTVFRSSKHIYAQLIDPEGRTIASVSTRSKGVSQPGATGNVEAAKRVGKAIAEIAKSKDIHSVVFNRNGFLFHGRVKALAGAAREAGLEF